MFVLARICSQSGTSALDAISHCPPPEYPNLIIAACWGHYLCFDIGYIRILRSLFELVQDGVFLNLASFHGYFINITCFHNLSLFSCLCGRSGWSFETQSAEVPEVILAEVGVMFPCKLLLRKWLSHFSRLYYKMSAADIKSLIWLPLLLQRLKLFTFWNMALG